MVVTVFSRIIQKKTESVLVLFRKILTEEQKLLYRSLDNGHSTITINNQHAPIRWDVPTPDEQAMKLIHQYDESTNTKHPQ